MAPAAPHQRTTAPTARDGPRAERADARRNRAALLAAAEEVFSEQGISAPIDEVARRAGVGVGTLYRHFPTKEALFEAIVAARIESLATRAEQLAREPDPAAALLSHISEVVAGAVAKKDLFDELARWGYEPIERVHAEYKQRLWRAGEILLRRAQQAGVVRPDLTQEDLTAMVLGTCEGACCALVDAARRPELSKRMVEVLWAGLQAR